MSGLCQRGWACRKLLILVLSPLLLLPLPLIIRTKEAECAFTLLLMAVLWISEALPISATALLPALLFPLFGIMKSSEVASMYFKDFHLLLLGVICLATAIEKWGLHQRIALRLVTLVGVNPGWLMLGFMAGCGFLSMWLSNTSTVTMVMPIVEAVIQQVRSAEDEAKQQRKKAMAAISNPGYQPDESEGNSDVANGTLSIERIDTTPGIPSSEVSPHSRRYRSHQDHMMCKGMSLCIAYSSTIGGLCTLPGTSSNLIFSEFIHQFYPGCSAINFGSWFLLCLPISIILLVLSWLWLHWMFLGSDFSVLFRNRKGQSERDQATAQVIQKQYHALGPMSRQELVTLVMFVVMAMLWFGRDPGFVSGWAALFPDHPGFATDATVAILLGLLVFIIPAGRTAGHDYEPMITWKEFQACMPWEVSLLVGGGFALAEGTKISGLASWVAELMAPLGSLPVMATITIACLIVTSITQVASNATTITIFLPILAPLAEAVKVNPLFILIPTTLSASFSFLFPVSNPPNAIVFTYGHLTTMDMVKAGLGMNILGLLAVLLAVSTWGTSLFSLTTYPDWAPGHNHTEV